MRCPPSFFATVVDLVEVRQRATHYVVGMCVLLASTLATTAVGVRPMEPAADPALGTYSFSFVLPSFAFVCLQRESALLLGGGVLDSAKRTTATR